MKSIAEATLTTYTKTVKTVLDAIGAKTILSRQKTILIKPNLVNSSPYPVTTPPDCCEAIITYLKTVTDAEIIIGEGCGDRELDTTDIFRILGYTKMAERNGIRLVDLNYEPLVKMSKPECPFFPEIYLPEIAMESFILSVPVLKAHSLATITGTLKNMVGLAPPEYYSGQFGIWKKAVFHEDIDQAVTDLNRYRTPDMTLIDAGIGLSEYHLGGPECNPPVGKLIAGTDPLEIDRRAADLLGIDWRKVPHLQ